MGGEVSRGDGGEGKGRGMGGVIREEAIRTENGGRGQVVVETPGGGRGGRGRVIPGT